MIAWLSLSFVVLVCGACLWRWFSKEKPPGRLCMKCAQKDRDEFYASLYAPDGVFTCSRCGRREEKTTVAPVEKT